MVSQEYLSKYSSISKETRHLCEMAEERLHFATDPQHDLNHVTRLLDDLYSLIQNENIKDINFDVLLPSIYWHDIWRSQYPTKDFRTLLVGLIFDGPASCLIFLKNCRRKRITKLNLFLIAYSIFMHSTPGPLRVFRSLTLESKLLSDVDSLDEWSIPRLNVLKIIVFAAKDGPNTALLKLGRWYLRTLLMKKGSSNYYFNWTKSVLPKRQALFLEYVDDSESRYSHLIK